MTNTIMKDILQQAKNIASSDKGVLIVGEYGSGKSWLAKRIHQLGNRKDKPFLIVDCRVLEPHEAFRKLFGYVDYSQNGDNISRGIFEQIQGGTIFFESFDSFPENVQQEVVKTEQTSRIQRVGSNETIEIEQPRIICSIEIKANHAVRDEPFLTDTILTNDPYIIGQPPLRQRREDIAPLIKTFLNRQHKNRPNISTRKVSPELIYHCIRYDWPGNVKQLKNAIEHAAITSENDVITLADMPISIKSESADNEKINHLSNNQSYRNAETRLIKSVLAKANSRKDAANLLGIDRNSFKAKIEGLNLVSKSPDS